MSFDGRVAMRSRRNPSRIAWASLLLAVLTWAAQTTPFARSVFAQAAKAARAQSLAPRSAPPNLGEVTPTLFRGAQPTPEGFRELQKMGVTIVVNLRDESGEIEAERREVEALGLRYVSIPWSGLHTPTSGQMAEFLELVMANPQKKIFVHCHHGADRTGVMVAAYRIALERWSPAQAVAEMRAFHYHRFWLPHLARYVEDFPQQLASDPAYHALQLALSPTAH